MTYFYRSNESPWSQLPFLNFSDLIDEIASFIFVIGELNYDKVINFQLVNVFFEILKGVRERIIPDNKLRVALIDSVSQFFIKSDLQWIRSEFINEFPLFFSVPGSSMGFITMIYNLFRKTHEHLVFNLSYVGEKVIIPPIPAELSWGLITYPLWWPTWQAFLANLTSIVFGWIHGLTFLKRLSVKSVSASSSLSIILNFWG